MNTLWFTYNFFMGSNLVIIPITDNARPHLARMVLLRLTDSGYEILPHLPYSPDLSVRDIFLKAFWILLMSKSCKRSWHDIERFLGIKIEFYCISINNLVNKYIGHQRLYFDWLKYWLDSFSEISFRDRILFSNNLVFERLFFFFFFFFFYKGGTK